MAEVDMKNEAPSLTDQAQFLHCNNLVQAWLNYCHDNPEIMLGTQLRAAAVCAAMSMRLCDIEEKDFNAATGDLVALLTDVYVKSADAIKPATLQ